MKKSKTLEERARVEAIVAATGGEETRSAEYQEGYRRGYLAGRRDAAESPWRSLNEMPANEDRVMIAYSGRGIKGERETYYMTTWRAEMFIDLFLQEGRQVYGWMLVPPLPIGLKYPGRKRGAGKAAESSKTKKEK